MVEINSQGKEEFYRVTCYSVQQKDIGVFKLEGNGCEITLQI